MKHLLGLLSVLIVAAFPARAETVVTTTTVTTTTTTGSSAEGPSVVAIDPGNNGARQVVVVNGESDLYHRRPQAARIDNGALLTIGAGALLWNGGYQYGRHRNRYRYRPRRYHYHRW